MTKRTAFILFALLLMTFGSAAGQEVAWSVDYSALFCNREGGDEQTPDQTFLHMRLAPTVGLSLMDGKHTLMGGITYVQPLNNNWSNHRITPTFYYRLRHHGWQFAMGFVPRTLLTEQAPRYLWSDSLAYYQPNIRGVLIQKYNRRGYAEFFLDWRQLQSTERREAFNVTFNSRFHITPLLTAGGHVQYNHLAKRKNAPEGEGVNDDATINPMLGLDFTQRTSLDTLAVEAGAIVQLQRCRRMGGWRTPAGFVLSASLRWRWLEAQQQLFVGKDLFPLYELFGSELNLGDPYYRYKVYSRTDVKAHIVNNRFVDLYASLSAHVTHKMFGFWQQIALRFYFDNNMWRVRKDRNALATPKLTPIY